MIRCAMMIALMSCVTATHAEEKKPATGIQFAGFLAARKTVHVHPRFDGVVVDVIFRDGCGLWFSV
jgi:hypothetical protein